jgi:hypothetical protein
MGYGRTHTLTAIGDTVNTASRFETLNKQYESQLIISDDVAARRPGPWHSPSLPGRGYWTDRTGHDPSGPDAQRAGADADSWRGGVGTGRCCSLIPSRATRQIRGATPRPRRCAPTAASHSARACPASHRLVRSRRTRLPSQEWPGAAPRPVTDRRPGARTTVHHVPDHFPASCHPPMTKRCKRQRRVCRTRPFDNRPAGSACWHEERTTMLTSQRPWRRPLRRPTIKGGIAAALLLLLAATPGAGAASLS